MGCCLSKKPSPSSNVTSSTIIRSPDPIKPKIEPIEETKPKSQKLNQEEEEEEEEEEVPKKEALVIKHRRSHEERSKKTDSDKDSQVSSPVAAEKQKPNSTTPVVRISSCTKEEVDAILIQCGKLSRSNSAAKTRRYSGSKRSFDFDQNGGDAAAEEVVEAEMQTHRNRHRGVERVNGSPRERRRRTPSRERDDSKSYRSGSRERGNNGGGSRRVSRSPAKRSEFPNVNNNRPGKFVTIPATDKSNNVEPSVKRVTVKRNIGDACRIAASPRSKSPARTGPSLSRSNSRKAEQSPYRRNPLGEIDQNSSRIGSCNNTKKTVESLKPNPRTSRAASPSSRAAVVEVAIAKPPQVVLNRSRSLRKSRDFDLVSNEDNNYTALLLKDIQNFHGKSVVEDNSVSLLPLCVTKACSIVEAVADLNSMANSNSDSSRFRFTSTAKKADLMEPSFDKYVTVKRGGSLEESSGSNNVT
ncbi:PREDICTED: uncharacterized protein At1g65710-like [Camelina sativa]|uniref:Uncharacterized protein At1g65710-like n=1 Tax=Camelina sativa TaxID=90675 RepID=A0ABM0Z6I5_CAMSA|nr:PREDICTED: uncharacterized protein At1g65710-like [Camelina sativa]